MKKQIENHPLVVRIVEVNGVLKNIIGSTNNPENSYLPNQKKGGRFQTVDKYTPGNLVDPYLVSCPIRPAGTKKPQTWN